MVDVDESNPEVSLKSYRRLRRRLKYKEYSNYDTIYIIPCSGSNNWHEIAEHSALIYYYRVVKKLNLKTKFYADYFSFYDQYDIGYIRTRSIDYIRRNLGEAGILKDEATEDGIIIFRLKISLTEDEMDELRLAEKKRRLENLTVGETGNLDPELHQLLVASSIRLHRLCNAHLDKLSSQTNGADVVRLMDGLLEKYHQMALIRKDTTARTIEKLDLMRTDIYNLIIKVKIVCEAKLWDFETASSVAETLIQIRDRIENDLRRYIKESKKGKGGTR